MVAQSKALCALIDRRLVGGAIHGSRPPFRFCSDQYYSQRPFICGGHWEPMADGQWPVVPRRMLGLIIAIKVSDLLGARPADPSWPPVYIASEACKSKRAAVNQEAAFCRGKRGESESINRQVGQVELAVAGYASDAAPSTEEEKRRRVRRSTQSMADCAAWSVGSDHQTVSYSFCLVGFSKSTEPALVSLMEDWLFSFHPPPPSTPPLACCVGFFWLRVS
jgi:hypothetical protein